MVGEMTENKRFKLKIFGDVDNPNEIILKDSCGQPLCQFISLDDARLVRDLMNELHEEKTDYYCSNEVLREEVQRLDAENQSIKKHIKELYDMVKVDVDNEIEVYPKILMEYILNILKIISDD